MKLRIIDRRSGVVLHEDEVLLGGYAVDGIVLLEFASGDDRHPMAALAISPDEAADLAARINGMTVLRLQQTLAGVES